MPRRVKTGRPAGRQDMFTEAQVEAALREKMGWMSETAKLLGCSYTTLGNYLQKYPNLRAVRKEIEEMFTDGAESKLIQAVSAGNMTAILFSLKCKGKDRGWIDTPQQGGGDDDTPPAPVKIVIDEIDASIPRPDEKKK